jgi:thiamine-monophosphate kinase
VRNAGEHALLARIRARVGRPPDFVRLALGDDAAIVEPARNTADVLTTDAIVEGVHFDRALMSPRDIGHRALAVNLSDLAAMGASPRVALVSLGLPDSLTIDEFDGLFDGLCDLAAAHATAIVGGNLTRSPGPLFVDVTVVGSVRPRRALLRRGGRAGDALFVSGTIGGAAAGLAWLRREETALTAPAAPGTTAAEQERASAVTRYRTPAPRVRLGTLVGRSRAASACMDLSDGLGDAVAQLAAASGLGARVEASALPVHPAVDLLDLAPEHRLTLALSSDDYELLFAVPRRATRALRAAAGQARVDVTRIGELTRPGPVVLVSAESECPWPAGFAHFSP